jgi:hypothetical protein
VTLTFPLAIVTVLGTFAFLGLAILGGGRFAAFFSRSALIVLVIGLVVISGAALFTSGNLSPGARSLSE